MIAVALKSVVALALSFALLAASRRSRASVRHLILASLFAFLLFLPAVQHFAPTLDVPVSATMQKSAELRPVISIVAPPQVERNVQASRRSLIALLPLVYVLGVIGLVGWLMMGVLRLRTVLRRAEVWRDGVMLSSDIAAPFTFHSTIVFPRNAIDWSADELARALQHEREHVRRRDWLLQIVARLVCALYWPNPLVWVAWRRFRLEAERACDDAVIQSFTPSAYAEQLVTLARGTRRGAALPALAMASHSKLAERVESILDHTQPRGPHGRPAAVAALAVMLALLVSVAPARFIRAAAWDDHQAEENTRDLGEALVQASQRGNFTTVRWLLDRGLDVNTVVHGDGSALIGAGRGGKLDMIRFLLGRGADINLGVGGDGNPLIAAANHGHRDAVELLLDEGADIDLIVPGDENALIGACERGHVDVIQLLIDRGADVNARVLANGGDVRTPLRMARRFGHEQVVRMLIAAGARD